MDEPRKIVLILGNGFDLDLGFKTSYKSFWKSEFCPRDYPSPLIDYLNGQLGQTIDNVRWYDLENSFLRYYRTVVQQRGHVELSGAEKRFIKEFDPNTPDRGCYYEYAETIDSLITKGFVCTQPMRPDILSIPYQEDLLHDSVWRDKEALRKIKEGLCEYLKTIRIHTTNKDSVAYLILLAVFNSADAGDFVSIYSFNYTPVPVFPFKRKNMSIHHVHGSCADGKIIVGTKDDLMINKDYDFLLKSMDPSFNPPDLVMDLLEADEVIIFGHSLGENDRQYFESFFKERVDYLHPSKKSITIFTLNIDSEMEIKRSLQKMTDGRLSVLYSMSKPHIIKTANLNDDSEALYNYLSDHHLDPRYVRDSIGKIISSLSES